MTAKQVALTDHTIEKIAGTVKVRFISAFSAIVMPETIAYQPHDGNYLNFACSDAPNHPYRKLPRCHNVGWLKILSSAKECA